MSSTKDKRDTLTIRINPEERDLIDRAATLLGKTRAEFILDAARGMAEEALLDQPDMAANPTIFAELVAALDRPPQPNERLRKTMRTPPPWDKE
ncbi:type II toxin-antitoxin system TacA family antitoxin [Pseudoduganella namucuonensis]|uniref:Uncharacterized conserved protein, DUF1778 family n=1 Tax=Pseudoduganella namucuonensis TaxID=1035707 RepID=A0A1I7M191_9BURK|nr:DUF1778 domain-containing protein [Pseudoduganella namucuonensis]SFV15669.1 Uncharacterized conserved protein, DUF1778 family [Pseudoduganella namucuonensis]